MKNRYNEQANEGESQDRYTPDSKPLRFYETSLVNIAIATGLVAVLAFGGCGRKPKQGEGFIPSAKEFAESLIDDKSIQDGCDVIDSINSNREQREIEETERKEVDKEIREESPDSS